MQVIWGILVPMIHWSETACSEALSSQKLSWTRGSYSHRLLSDPIRSSSQDLLRAINAPEKKIVWFLFTEAISFVHPSLLKTGASEFVQVAKGMQRWHLNGSAFGCLKCLVKLWNVAHEHGGTFVLAYFQPASSQSGCLDPFAPGARSKTCASLAAPTFNQFGGRVSNLLALRQVGCFFGKPKNDLIKVLKSKVIRMISSTVLQTVPKKFIQTRSQNEVLHILFSLLTFQWFRAAIDRHRIIGPRILHTLYCHKLTWLALLTCFLESIYPNQKRWWFHETHVTASQAAHKLGLKAGSARSLVVPRWTTNISLAVWVRVSLFFRNYFFKKSSGLQRFWCLQYSFKSLWSTNPSSDWTVCKSCTLSCTCS